MVRNCHLAVTLSLQTKKVEDTSGFWFTDRKSTLIYTTAFNRKFLSAKNQDVTTQRMVTIVSEKQNSISLHPAQDFRKDSVDHLMYTGNKKGVI